VVVISDMLSVCQLTLLTPRIAATGRKGYAVDIDNVNRVEPL